nr:reverse transcriptase domain-containing protein [Tanacetum cinerariifolium]
MENVIVPDQVDEVPVVEPNQHDDVPVVPELVLVDEDEDPKEDEFEEEEDPQDEEDDMEINIEENENEPELTYPYEEVDPLNPSSPTSESELDDEIKVENLIEHEDETVPTIFHEVGESYAAPFLREDSDSLLPGLIRRDINSLFGQMASILRRLCGREMTHALFEKKGKAKDKLYGKLILKLGNKVRSGVEEGTATMEKMVEKLGNTEDKVECKKLKKEVKEERGFMFEERPSEAINVPIEDEKSPSSESRRSPLDLIMPPKSAPMTQAAIRRMIKDSVDAAIAAERAKQANVRNDASGSGPVRGQDAAPTVHECTFARGKKVKFTATTLEGPALTWWKTKVATVGLEMVKEYDVVAYTQRFNELALMCPRMVEPELVKVDAYISGLTDNIKDEVKSSKPADLNEARRMAHKLMEHKSQAKDAGILEGNKQKIAKSKDMRELLLSFLLMEIFLCVNDVLHTMLASVRSSVTSMERLGIRNRCPKKVKQEEVRETRGRAYAIKDAEPQGLNVVTGASYEVELDDGRVASTDIVLKSCTLNLVNYIFEIDLVPIELGTFDVIIGMDWLVKHDAVIVYGEKRKKRCSPEEPGI